MSFLYGVAADILEYASRRVTFKDEFMDEVRYRIDGNYIVTINKKEKKCHVSLRGYGILRHCDLIYKDGITPEEIMDWYYHNK